MELRAVAALGMRLAANLGRVPADEPALQNYLSRLSAVSSALIARMGWRAAPALPGQLRRAVGADGRLRRLYVAKLYRADEPFGTLFTLIVPNRDPIVSVGPDDCLIRPAVTPAPLLSN